MAVTIKLPTGLTFATCKIAVPALGLAIGDVNPFWTQVLELGVAGSLVRGATDEAPATYGPIKNTRWISIDDVPAVVAAGGDFEGWLVFFKIPEADYETADVPAGFPFGTITELSDPTDPESNPVTRRRKWSEWKLENHIHRRVEGFYYVHSNSNDRMLNASEWFPFLSGGLDVVTNIPEPAIEDVV